MRVEKLFLLLAFPALLIALPSWAAGSASFTRIDPDKAHRLLQDGKVDLLLDVRTMDYYTGPSGRLSGAFLIPIHDLAARLDSIKNFRDKTILVYCEVGIWSQDAARLLVKEGFSNVLELEGGIKEWEKKGYPVVR